MPPAGAVVGGENHQGVFIQLEIPQRLEDTPDAVVHFLHMGTVDITLCSFEILGTGIARFVDMGVGNIAKERLLVIFLNEGYRFIGDDFGQ